MSDTLPPTAGPPSPTPACAADSTTTSAAVDGAVASSAAGPDDLIAPPKYDERVQGGYVPKLLGLQFRADKKPLQDIVREVWRGQPDWTTTRRSYTELPEQQRKEAEQELQRKLEALYTPETPTGTQIRRCRTWLSQHLLGEKHRTRFKESKPKRLSPPSPPA